MSVNSEIRDGLIAIFKSAHVDTSAFSGRVVSVDIPTRSCVVESISGQESVEYPNVWLMACQDDGILYIPKVGSVVIVENNANLQPYIVMWSAIESISYVIDKVSYKMSDAAILLAVKDTTLSMTNGLTKFNDGSNAGMVKVIELTTELNKIQTDLALLKTALAAMLVGVTTTKTSVIGAPTAPVIGSVLSPMTAAMVAAIPPYLADVVPLTLQSLIEDKKVTH